MNIVEASMRIVPVIASLKCFFVSVSVPAAKPNGAATNANAARNMNPMALDVS